MDETPLQQAVVIHANMGSIEIEKTLNDRFKEGYTYNTTIHLEATDIKAERQIIILDKTYI